MALDRFAILTRAKKLTEHHIGGQFICILIEFYSRLHVLYPESCYGKQYTDNRYVLDPIHNQL